MDAAVKELERSVKDLGLIGWKTHCNYGDIYLDDKRFWPILAKCEELDAPIYLHPTMPKMEELRTYGVALAGPPFGFGVETALVMYRLILSGAFDAFPKLKLVLGHYGEFLPFLMHRIDWAYARPHVVSDIGRHAAAQEEAQRVPAREHVGVHQRQLPAGRLRLHQGRAGHGPHPAGHRPPVRQHAGMHWTSWRAWA